MDNSHAAAATVDLPNAEPSSEMCSICCDPIQVVAVGRCNHTLTCAICTLRLRLCYKDNACPFCKARLKQVYLIEKPLDGTPLSFDHMTKHRSQFATDKHWSPGIWVDKESQCDGRPLMEYLKSRMKMSCSICDPSALHEEFESFKQLREHLKKTHHGSTVCSVCYQANRFFPRELEIFKNDKELRVHAESHPKCEYCGQHYFGKDELYNHMKKKHCLCHLCHARGERHLYFQDTQHYIRHLREAHFVCNEPGCVNCLIAFNTAQDLTDHLLEAHGVRSVPLTGRRQIARNANPRVNAIAARFPVAPRLNAQWRGFEGNDLQQRGGEGLMMIDDDMPPEFAAVPVVNQRRPLHAPSQARHVREDFPALPAPNPSTLPQAQPRKVLMRTECPCSRLSRSVLVVEGTRPDALKCDAECERAKHRARLAAAFNIDTATYSGAFNATFSVDLISWARQFPQRVQQIEEQIYERIRLRDVQRFNLEGITRDMKKLVIELAESCGAVGRSVRNANAVEVVLTSRCRLPARKLVQYATSLSKEEYQDLVRESLRNVILLEDIQRSVNPKRYLMSWDGDYEMEFISNSVAKLKFRTPQAFKSACDGLGGGIRDAFRVRCPLKDTEANPPTSEPPKPRMLDEDGFNRTFEKQKGRKNPWAKDPAPEELTLGNSFEALSRL